MIRGLTCPLVRIAPNVARLPALKRFSAKASSGTQQAEQSAGRTAGVVVFTAMVGTTVGLGAWQASRYFWKVDVIKQRSEALQLPPVDVTETRLEDVPQLQQDVLQLVTVRGVLDMSRAVSVSPRPPPKGIPDNYVPASGNNGALLIAPLVRPDGSEVLLLRGWYPKDALPPREPHAPPRDAASVQYTGALRSSETEGAFTIAHRLRDNEFSWVDLRGIAAHCSLRTAAPAAAAGASAAAAASATMVGAVVAVEALDPLPPRPGAYPLTKQRARLAETFVMPHTHLIYAGTWFALAVFGAAIARARFGRGGAAGARRAAAAAARQQRSSSAAS